MRIHDRRKRRRRDASHLLVAARRAEVVAVGGLAEPDGDLRVALAGDLTLTYVGADPAAAVQESAGTRDGEVAELSIPAPMDGQALAGLLQAHRTAQKVAVYAAYRLDGGVPVDVESFTMVGEGLYLDLGDRNAARR